MGNLPNCPACRCYDVRVLSECGAGLTSYVCHDCHKVFHVAERSAEDRTNNQDGAREFGAPPPLTAHRKVR